MFYIHTIDGHPAYFSARDGQIVFAENLATWRDAAYVCVGHRSLAKIKEEQLKSEEYRLRRKFDVPNYGYVAVGTSPRKLKPKAAKKERG